MIPRFKEFQVVKCTRNIDNISKGTTGVVLIVYETNQDYEVEFVDKNKNSLGTFTVKENDIENVA